MQSYKTIKNRLLKDKTTHKLYNDIGAEFALIESIIEKRLAKGLTQTELANMAGTKQSAIARLESGRYNPSLVFLGKIAKALDTKVVVSLV